MENLNFFKLLLFRIYHFLFIERFFKKLSFNFPENIYRWNLIQLIIDKYNFNNYLEIGCDKNKSFSKIIVNNKVGVDPISGGTIRSTSDDFFLKNLNNNYDVIFIDGLHYYEQVIKDIKNSLINSKMGLNLSRGVPTKYYTSNRIASILGNGLLTFVDKKTQLNDFFSDKEVIFYNNIDELASKIKYYSKNDTLRKKIAKSGKDKYFKLFDGNKIAKHIVDISLGNKSNLF